MDIIAHRGATETALENSLEAFTEAVDLGAKFIELDVRLSSDDKVFIMHDNSLSRTTDSHRKISELTAVELQYVKLSNGENVPSLKTVLDQYLDKIGLNIELKQDSKILCQQTADLVSTNRSCKNVIISSFYTSNLDFLSTYAPDLQLALLWGEDNSKHIDPEEYLRKNPGLFFHPQCDLLNKELVSKVKQFEGKIYPWVPSSFTEEDETKTWIQMKNLAVDGLCTNFPKSLCQWLKSNSC